MLTRRTLALAGLIGMLAASDRRSARAEPWSIRAMLEDSLKN
jgi:hypothetical protein